MMQLDVLYEWLNLLQSVMIPFALLPVSLPVSWMPCSLLLHFAVVQLASRQETFLREA